MLSHVYVYLQIYEEKVLQIHLVSSVYLIKMCTLLQHMAFPCGSWAPAFFLFFYNFG